MTVFEVVEESVMCSDPPYLYLLLLQCTSSRRKILVMAQLHFLCIVELRKAEVMGHKVNSAY